MAVALRRLAPGLTPEMVAAVSKLMRNQDLVAVAAATEVVTGFRHHLGGYQAISGIRPDLTTFAKAIANGYPLAVLCGRADLMDRFNTRPDGTVMFGGTYNGHPMSLAAALATIEILEADDRAIHRRLFRLGETITTELRGIVDVHTKAMYVFRAVQPAPFVVERRGVVDLLVRVPAYFLAETTYTVYVTVMTVHGKESKVVLPSALTFMAYGETETATPKGQRSGVLAPRLEWQTQAHLSARKKSKTVA